MKTLKTTQLTHTAAMSLNSNTMNVKVVVMGQWFTMECFSCTSSAFLAEK
jgi:hypothetical protein